MITSTTSEDSWPPPVATAPFRLSVNAPADRHRRTTIPGLLSDAGLLLLVVILVPLIIVLAGAPVALLARLLLEIARRL
jgi:hypothetical protein